MRRRIPTRRIAQERQEAWERLRDCPGYDRRYIEDVARAQQEVVDRMPPEIRRIAHERGYWPALHEYKAWITRRDGKAAHVRQQQRQRPKSTYIAPKITGWS